MALVLGLALVAGVVNSQADGGDDPLSIVVSIQPWADVIAQLGGDRVEVSTLLPAGASPHAFEPLPSQAVALARADLVVMNGGLDSWLERMLTAAAPGVPTLHMMSVVNFDPLQEVGHEGEERAGADAHSATSLGANPHIWLDPMIVARALPVLVAALVRADPTAAPAYERNAAALEADLLRVDAHIKTLFVGLEDASFVPLHDAWAYFARRYGLRIAVTLEPFPGREPSARYVADTVMTIRETGARVIFAERQLSDRTARVVAESAGVAVVTLDPLGGHPGPERYQDLLVYNANIIADALR
ncbi:MAG TPA: metal ABC transporter substrate-binding protein [Trueperaceae bacterium]|nr:metal ABC transporter substrate-binding protein [Trueperaceae bacterium]